MLKWLIKLLISVGLIAFVLWRLDWKTLSFAMSQIQPAYFFVACLVLIGIHFIPSLAQQKLFQGVGLSFQLIQIYMINLKSMFYSLALPGDMAGGIARYVQFSKASVTESAKLIRSDLLTVMALERLLNMLALLLLLNIFHFIIPNRFPFSPMLNRVILITDLILLCSLIATYFLPWERLLSILPDRVAKMKVFLHEIVQLIRKIHFLNVVMALLLMMGFQLVAFLFFDIVLAKCLHLTLPWMYFAVVVFLSRFLKFFPLTYAGIGISESLYPLFLQQQAVTPEQATVLAFLGTLASLILALLGGICAMIELTGLGKKKI